MKLLVIGLGGFIGAILRYGVSGWVYKIIGARMPFGTLAVNILGSFILGLFLFLAEGRFNIGPLWRGFIAFGMMGALTTFSTFSYETLAFLQGNLWLQAFLNFLFYVLLSLFVVFVVMVLV